MFDIITTNINILFLALLFCILIFVIFVHRFNKNHLNLPYLVGSFAFMLVGYVCMYFYFMNSSEFLLMRDWGFLSFNIAIYSLSSHFESLYSPKPLITGRNAYTLVIFILSSLLYILHIAGLPQFQDVSLNYVFTTLFSVGLFIFGIWIINAARKISNSISIVVELSALFLSLIASVFYALYFIIPYFTPIPQENFSGLLLIGGIFSLGGVTCYCIVIFKFHAIFHLPHPIYYILIYSGVGLPIYQRKLAQSPENNLDEESLLPALFSAIDGFIRATLGTQEKLNSIEGDNFRILFSPFYDENIVFCVITTHGSYYLDRAILKFVKSIPSNVLLNADQHAESKEFRQTIDQLLRKSFPFLEI